MTDFSADLRARIASSNLTIGRVTGRTVIDFGRRFLIRQPDLRVVRPRDCLLEFRFVIWCGRGRGRPTPICPLSDAAHQPILWRELFSRCRQATIRRRRARWSRPFPNQPSQHHRREHKLHSRQRPDRGRDPAGHEMPAIVDEIDCTLPSSSPPRDGAVLDCSARPIGSPVPAREDWLGPAISVRPRNTSRRFARVRTTGH